jgi:hypothetical protein
MSAEELATWLLRRRVRELVMLTMLSEHRYLTTEQIGEALDRNDLNRLLIHGRFLEARFAQAPSGLGLPKPGASGPDS